MHHIVSDGWSISVLTKELAALYAAFSKGQDDPLAPLALHLLTKELAALYAAFSQGQDDPLAPLALHYLDYAVWQRRWLSGERLQQQSTYWQQALADAPALLMLPTDRVRPAQQDYAGAALPVVFDEDLTRGLKALSQRHGTTLYMTVMAAWAALLGRLAGQEEVVIGTPVANRTRSEVEGLIGLFVNTLAIRVDLGAQPTAKNLLAQVKTTTLGAQAHQDLPFEQLVEALQPERSLSHSPLFQVIYNHQAEGPGELHRLPGLTVQGLSWDSHVAQFDLALDTHENTDGLSAALTYSSALFDSSTIERMAAHWRNLLGAIAAGAHRRVVELPMLSADERQRIVVDWNQSEASYPTDRCIHQLIAEQSRETPQAAALLFDDGQMSYQQLDLQSNRLARKLRELGVGPDVLVGVALERGPQMLVGLLAILKAGGAYVPLDPEYPLDRLHYMIEDSGT